MSEDSSLTETKSRMSDKEKWNELSELWSRQSRWRQVLRELSQANGAVTRSNLYTTRGATGAFRHSASNARNSIAGVATHCAGATATCRAAAGSLPNAYATDCSAAKPFHPSSAGK